VEIVGTKANRSLVEKLTREPRKLGIENRETKGSLGVETFSVERSLVKERK
tara:strand:+ start:400 stop:552 length:153 start_codon:yes stop_codon:yes gene_type:complete